MRGRSFSGRETITLVPPLLQGEALFPLAKAPRIPADKAAAGFHMVSQTFGKIRIHSGPSINRHRFFLHAAPVRPPQGAHFRLFHVSPNTGRIIRNGSLQGL